MHNSFYGFQSKNSMWGVKQFNLYQSTVEQLTVRAVNNSWLSRADYLDPFGSPQCISHICSIRLSHYGTAEFDIWSAIPCVWGRCLVLSGMSLGYPRHLCGTGRYDTRSMGDPRSSVILTGGLAKSPTTSESALGWAYQHHQTELDNKQCLYWILE